MTSASDFPLQFGLGPIPCTTFAVDVRFEPVSNPRVISTRREGDTIYMIVPDSRRLDEPGVRATLRAVLRQVLRVRAGEYLPDRLMEMQSITRLECARLKITSAATRWGSCNNWGGINLSCYMMLLPPRMIDYIITHELCHTVHMNHGPEFKALLHSFFPDWREIEKSKIEYDRATIWTKLKQ